MVAIVIILILITAVLLFDFCDSFLTWLGRIKLGAVPKEEWSEKIKTVILHWIDRGTPTVPADENARLKLIKMIKNHGKVSSIAYWQDAAVIKAASLSDDFTPERAEKVVNRYIDGSGEWKQLPERIDCAMLAYELMQSDFVDNDRIEPAIRFTADMLTEKAKHYGAIPYNDFVSNISFVDTIGMTAPFMIKYGVEYASEEMIKLAVREICSYRKNGFDEKIGLPFHCFDRVNNTAAGLCGWGRGCAWWALGVTEGLKVLLETDGYNKEKAVLLKYSMEILESTEKYHSADGSYGRFLTVNSAEDSSAAAMLAYCNALMFTITGKERYKNSAERTLNHLVTRTRRNGVIDFSQGDTMGIGYYSSSLRVMPAAQGFAVAADYMI